MDFKEIENEMLEFWAKNDIYNKSKSKNSSGKKFCFLQGPPYTSGKLHIGHAWNNAMKDIALRFFRLKGFDVWDRAGYDMHGLPTANKVQKELGLKDKEDILKFGLDKFNTRCQEFSVDAANEMSKDLRRLGIWMDFEDPSYCTYEGCCCNLCSGIDGNKKVEAGYKSPDGYFGSSDRLFY